MAYVIRNAQSTLRTFSHNFPVDGEGANLLLTCCGLVSVKSTTNCCYGIWETTQHNRHKRLLPTSTCYRLFKDLTFLLRTWCGLATGKSQTGVIDVGLYKANPNTGSTCSRILDQKIADFVLQKIDSSSNVSFSYKTCTSNVPNNICDRWLQLKSQPINETLQFWSLARQTFAPNRAAFYSLQETYARKTCKRKHDTWSITQEQPPSLLQRCRRNIRTPRATVCSSWLGLVGDMAQSSDLKLSKMPMDRIGIVTRLSPSSTGNEKEMELVQGYWACDGGNTSTARNLHTTHRFPERRRLLAVELSSTTLADCTATWHVRSFTSFQYSCYRQTGTLNWIGKRLDKTIQLIMTENDKLP